MVIFDMTARAPAALSWSGDAIETDVSQADLAALHADVTAAIAIRFTRFTDGRGFTLARHLREARGHTGAILACGHLIPDQADYLRRCGFSHVEIRPDAATQWQRSLSLTPPSMQRLLDTRRARYSGHAAR